MPSAVDRAMARDYTHLYCSVGENTQPKVTGDKVISSETRPTAQGGVVATDLATCAERELRDLEREVRANLVLRAASASLPEPCRTQGSRTVACPAPVIPTSHNLRSSVI